MERLPAWASWARYEGLDGTLGDQVRMHGPRSKAQPGTLVSAFGKPSAVARAVAYMRQTIRWPSSCGPAAGGSMVSIGSALKDAPRMAREAGKMLFVLEDSLQRDQALVSDKAPQRGGRYNVLAMYTPGGERVDYCGPVTAGASVQSVAREEELAGRKIAVAVAQAPQAAVAQALQDTARERATHEINSLRDDLLAMLDLVSELEQRGSGGLDLQDILDALGHAADTCYETTCSDY